MDKMRMESKDLTAGNIEKIGALFPDCITETVGADGKPKKAINFDILRQMLSPDVVEGDEAYEFTWVGKKAAMVEAHRPIRKTLRPCVEESVDWDKTENLYIEGDNLEVLKLLQESYLGAVKMIYIVISSIISSGIRSKQGKPFFSVLPSKGCMRSIPKSEAWACFKSA